MKENDVFEITDFTIVTDTETFSDAFEAILQKFDCFGRRPSLQAQQSEKQLISKAVLSFGSAKLDINFLQNVASGVSNSLQGTGQNQQLLSSFTAGQELKEFGNDFKNSTGIALKFGIRECIIITTNDDPCPLDDENLMKTLMGTIKTVLHTSRCEVPVFLYAKNKSLEMIEGYASDGNENIVFSSTVLRNINKRHCYMNELIHIFKEHLGASTSAFHDEVKISTKFTHVAKLFNDIPSRFITAETVRQLTIGPVSGFPFESIEIGAIWQLFRENSLTENHEHTDFGINYATTWNVQVKASEYNLMGCFDKLLGVYMDDRKKDMRTDRTCEAILGTNFFQKQAPVFKNLTVNSASELQIGGSNHAKANENSGPISRMLIKEWVDFIFDASADGTNLAHQINLLAIKNEQKNVYDEKIEQFYNFKPLGKTDFLAPYKCAKQNTLAWRMAVALANIRVFLKSEPRAEPQLWVELISTLRQKYDNMECIDDVKNGIDNMQCLFSQKLQMLQLCINARKKRHINFDNSHGSINDEFFDANDTFNCINSSAPLKEAKLMLIGNPEKEMIKPITQDICPLTDDMIDARNNTFLNLTDEDRVETQLGLIKSDMQSFKAANPDAVFADFLRWHSPKDYDEKTNTISERMLIPGNVWAKNWEDAQAVAASNQTRIFNDSKIAEEIFEMFENATLDAVRDWIKPTVFAASLERVQEIEAEDKISENKRNQFIDMANVLVKASTSNSKEDYNEVAKFCCQNEMILNMKTHLAYLFDKAIENMHPPYPTQNEIKETIEKLINITLRNLWSTGDLTANNFFVKPQEPIGRAIAEIWKSQNSTFDQLNIKKEYIFLWNLKRPSTTSLSMTHRMYANLTTDSHKLYMSVSCDANFFNVSLI